MTSKTATLRSLPAEDEFAREILVGLRAPQKQISSKWLYDDRGSALFEKITQLAEYYPTRTEAAILEDALSRPFEIAAPGAAVIEYGSGAGIKTRKLINALSPRIYVPVDISEDFMLEAAAELNRDFPALIIRPVAGDFTGDLPLPELFREAEDRLAFFPGSTIGNFEKQAIGPFFETVRTHTGFGGRFLLGADLVKETDILERAYDDRDGVTAAFNLNLLERLNRELDADFDTGAFRHHAPWIAEEERIEMRLVSAKHQTVTIAGEEIFFTEGEYIHTENSHKFTLEGLTEMADLAGWRVQRHWTDEREWFALLLLEAV